MSASVRVKAVVVAATMGLAAAGAYWLKPRTMLAEVLPPLKLEQSIPSQFGEWQLLPSSGGGQVVNPQTQALLNQLYTDILTRVYVNPKGERIMLSIAYGRNQSDDKAVHYPEVCYPAQGFSIDSKVAATMDIAPGVAIPVKKLLARQQSRIEPITYWVTVGDKVTLTGLEHKLAQLDYGLHGIIPDGMIFRVSSIGSDAEQQYGVQQGFVNELVAALPQAVRSRVVGHSPTKGS